MKFGLLIGDTATSATPPSGWLSDCLRMAAAAEGAGFDSIAAGQHFAAYPKVYPQPIPLLARIAGEVPSLRLITGILLLPLLPPLEVAEQVATLDVISGGRVIMGVGAGYREDEFHAFGVPFKQRVSRLVESLELIKKLWTGETVDFTGRYFQTGKVRCGIRPVQQPGPAIWMAGSVDAAVRRAATLADAFYGYTRSDIGLLAGQQALYRRTLAGNARKDPGELPLRREVFIAETSSAAWERAEALIGPHLAAIDSWGMSKDLGKAGSGAASFRDYSRGRFIIGDPDECAAQVEAYREGLGPCHIVTRIRWPGMTATEGESAVRLFGAEVVSRFRSA
ncbi:MAG: LLM class flavin-dependent oxidoreductase [Betaproteobacteria bacterium]|nr:LLM class flavin-dependent oxidoreductase [Betaproteobacteria bacterium]